MKKTTTKKQYTCSTNTHVKVIPVPQITLMILTGVYLTIHGTLTTAILFDSILTLDL